MDEFERKVWYQSDTTSGGWVWTCPKEYCRLNARQFPVLAQTYLGVRQECLRGLKGMNIRQKSGGGREDMNIICDPYGEKPVKATLPRVG
jgi:hypothetical protein